MKFHRSLGPSHWSFSEACCVGDLAQDPGKFIGFSYEGRNFGISKEIGGVDQSQPESALAGFLASDPCVVYEVLSGNGAIGFLDVRADRCACTN